MSTPSMASTVVRSRGSTVQAASGSGLKKHLCPRCGRGFARREHLERHERSHTKEQPFRCKLCLQAFTRKDLLKRHHGLIHEHPQSLSADSVVAFENQTRSSIAGQNPPPPISNETDDTTSLLLSQMRASTEDTLLSSMPTLNTAQSWDTGNHDNSLDIFRYVALDDFDAFTDSFVLPSHPYSPSHQPLPPLSDEFFTSFATDVSSAQPISGTNPATSETYEPEGLSRYGSRLPSLDPEEYQSRNPYEIPKGATNCQRLSPSCMEQMRVQLASFSNVAPNTSTLPSRHTLNRFIHGYIRGFHRHYPLFHLPTLTLEGMPVELLLAIASVGAQYCLEHSTGFRLFYLAKSLVTERLRRYDNASDVLTAIKVLHAVHTLLLLIAVSMWSEDQPPFHEALSIRSILERLLQNVALREYAQANTNDWTTWVTNESIKRATIIAYCFFNMHTIVFDVGPMMLVQDVHCDLPCSEKEWEARNADDWRNLRQKEGREISFQRAFSTLFTNVNGEENCIALSTLASHGLIHAIIQRIWLLHQATRLPGCDGGLSQSDIVQLERVLKRWRSSWERDEEASASPLGDHGPMSFTSTALLRLAYIRINMDSRTALPSMSSWDPERIAANFAAMPTTQRSARATRAALHCAHGLSIPVQLGIDFVARTQVFFWSNQYALCSLESALFLTKWLEAVTTPDRIEALASEESRLLEFVLQMVAETEYAADSQYLLATKTRLGAIVTRLWAKLFRSDCAWEFVGLIGRSLLAYADLIERTDS